MPSVAIIGASGYAGGELVRFLDAHPFFDVVFLGGHSSAGMRLGDVHPHLSGGDRHIGSIDDAPTTDLTFLALPHGASAEPAMAFAARGSKIVDIGSDFRLDTSQRYVEAYGAAHPFPNELGTWAYGIPELFGDDIAAADHVAAPGCYPTSALLGLGPLVAADLVSPTGIVVSSMSGVSGAGRGANDALHFGAIDESVKAYKVLEHRHRPEMERALDGLSDVPSQVLFVPHLVPMQRGILSTIYVAPSPGVTRADLEQALDKAYTSSIFVRRIDSPPETRWVVGSNNALLSVHLDDRSDTAIILCAIDNLVKGAAGQAVQCANLMFSFEDSLGLPTEGWMP